MYSLSSFNGAAVQGSRAATPAGARTEHRPTHPHQRPPPVQAHRRAACGAREAAKQKGSGKNIYIKKREQCKPRFSWRERRGKASSRCPVLPPDPRPGPAAHPNAVTRPPPATERNGKVRSTHPGPAPPPPGAGWINKPSGQRPRSPVPCPLHSFLPPSSPASLLSPLLASISRSPLPFSYARACARHGGREGNREGRADLVAAGGCTDLRPACPRCSGEAASASRNGQLVAAVYFAYHFLLLLSFQRRL